MQLKVKNLSRFEIFKLFIYFTNMAAIVPGAKKEMAEIAVKFVYEINKYMNDTHKTIVTKHMRLKMDYMTDYQFKDMLMDSELQLLIPYVQSIQNSAGYTSSEEKELLNLKFEKENENPERNN